MEIIIQGLLLPFKALALVIDFIVWEFFSTGKWKTWRLRVNQIWLLQGLVDQLEAEIAKKDREHSREINDLLVCNKKEVERLNKELRDRHR